MRDRGVPRTYHDAGVDVDVGDELSAEAGRAARSTFLSFIRQQGGVPTVDVAALGIPSPQLLLASDSVGTKLKIAFMADKHDTVGIDVVAMCVNDLARYGARSAGLSAYFAAAHLDPEVHRAVIAGVCEGCRRAGCSLIGGETAELPGLYAPGEYDLAATAMGVLQSGRALSRERVVAGDALIGLRSSGVHSNGFSLVRRVLLPRFALSEVPPVNGIARPLVDELLEPTRIYTRTVDALLAEVPYEHLHAISHITGGGLTGKGARVVPPGLTAFVHRGSWPVHPIFRLIQTVGEIADAEMYATFNMGLGMVLAVAPDAVPAVLHSVQQSGETAWHVGEVAVARSGDAPLQLVDRGA